MSPRDPSETPSINETLPNPQSDIQHLDLQQLYQQLQDDCEISNEEMMHNQQPIVQYIAYVENLQNTIEYRLKKPVDLKQNKDIKRLKMTITTLHHQQTQHFMDSKKIEKIGSNTLHISQTRPLFDETLQYNEEYEDKNFTKVNWRVGQQNLQNFQEEPFSQQTHFRRKDQKRNSSVHVPCNTQLQESLPAIVDEKYQTFYQNKKQGNFQQQKFQGKVDPSDQLNSVKAQIQQALQDSKQLTDDMYDSHITYMKSKYRELEDRIQSIIVENRQLPNGIKIAREEIQFHKNQTQQNWFNSQQDQTQKKQKPMIAFNNQDEEEINIQQREQEDSYQDSPVQSRQLRHYSLNSRRRSRDMKLPANDLFVINLSNTSQQFIEGQEQSAKIHNLKQYALNKQNHSFNIKEPPIFQPINFTKDNSLNMSKILGISSSKPLKKQKQHQYDSLNSSVKSQLNNTQKRKNIFLEEPKQGHHTRYNNNSNNPQISNHQRNSRQLLESIKQEQKLGTLTYKYDQRFKIKKHYQPVQMAKTLSNHRHLDRKIFNQDEWLYKQIKDMFNLPSSQQSNDYTMDGYKPHLPNVNRVLFINLTLAQEGEESQERGISEEQIESMTDSKDIKDTGTSEEDKKLMEEWEKYMSDFVPEDLSTIVIEPKGETTFYEDIGQEQVYVRGAYFVGSSSTSNKLIDFFVVNPKNKVIFSRRKAEEGIFRFNATIPGRYAFIFSNVKDRKSTKDVTIAIHAPGNEAEAQQEELIDNAFNQLNKEELIKDVDVQVIKTSFKDIYDNIRQIQTEAKLSFIRQTSVNSIVEDNNSYNFYMVLFESVFFVVICGAQVYYIKNILENKRLI